MLGANARSGIGRSLIGQAAEALRSGGMSAQALTQSCLEAIGQQGARLNALITVLGEQALQIAAERDRERARGHFRGPLHGIPLVIKDNIDLAGCATTAGSRLFAGRTARTSAPIVSQLQNAGAIILAKANMNELAAGLCGRNEAFGNIRNPWDATRSAGGSSGGAASAVAANLCHAGIGTDTGGSIRFPAACCGVVGLRPTHGLVSQDGILPRAPSFDIAGPITQYVADAAILLDALTQNSADARRKTAQDRSSSYTRELGEGIAGLRLGVIKDFGSGEIAADMRTTMEQSLGKLSELGADVIEVETGIEDVTEAASALFRTLLLYEFNEAMTGMCGDDPAAHPAIGAIARADLEAARDVHRAGFESAKAELRNFTKTLRRAFTHVDALVSPAMDRTAPRFEDCGDAFESARRYMLPFTCAALPSIVVPAAMGAGGLPIGLQFVGDRFGEARLLRIASAFEASVSFREAPIIC